MENYKTKFSFVIYDGQLQAEIKFLWVGGGVRLKP